MRLAQQLATIENLGALCCEDDVCIKPMMSCLINNLLTVVGDREDVE